MSTHLASCRGYGMYSCVVVVSEPAPRIVEANDIVRFPHTSDCLRPGRNIATWLAVITAANEVRAAVKFGSTRIHGPVYKL